MTVIERIGVVLMGALAALLVCVWVAGSSADATERAAKRRDRVVRVFPLTHRFKTPGRCLHDGHWIKGCR